jgi:putative SOS response-associated peptidase YedK
MCNLFRLRARPDHLRELLHYMEDHDFPPRSYVSPGSPIDIVRAEKDVRHLALVRWGFVPAWAKEVAPGKPLTNARSETILEKASFKNAVRRRRCLIPADGYYEWSGELGRKQASGSIGREPTAASSKPRRSLRRRHCRPWPRSIRACR